ncbi:histone-lysine N-methyltransferase, H3 lysine-79 specific [Drosophila rhopaloa]|uniref:Histone-lysine N-methyltransferase, H3 lysine-79 specific n=1 Tax=Drosophila rhopaloa TaxID=1041015 RepID=A0A6P4FZI6_DRORH|nr:histone-lysine N-methyltransferase, H3 lysine-79 specific [Drosophila rhopaloa]
MSRFLITAKERLQRGLRFGQMLIHNTGPQQMAAKKPTPPPPKVAKATEPPPKSSKPPKCPGGEKANKRKPGFFASGGQHAVLSDCPKPEGDFMRAWSAKNSRYNLILISGVLAAGGSLGFALSSGILGLNWTIPEYPYTEDEMEDFEIEEERRREEKEAREERHQDAVEARELGIRRRRAKEAMEREVDLMQRDMEGGISDAELDELQRLAADREAFELWEKDELKRLEEQEKEREKIRKEKAKVRAERQKERDRKQKEKEAQEEKEEAERQKARDKARKEREKTEKEKQKEKEKAEKEAEKARKAAGY